MKVILLIVIVGVIFVPGCHTRSVALAPSRLLEDGSDRERTVDQTSVTNSIYGIHDYLGLGHITENNVEKGWIFDVQIVTGGSADYSVAIEHGVNVIVRLNQDWGMPTVPEDEAGVEKFCKDIKIWLGRTTGIYGIVIGNEPNIEGRSEDRHKMDPTSYGRVFSTCYKVIKPQFPDLKIMPAAIAGYSPDEFEYFEKILLEIRRQGLALDGLTDHPKTRNCKTSSCFETENAYANDDFDHYRKIISLTAKYFYHPVPVFLTEIDPHYDNSTHFWTDSNGWVQAAYEHINLYNQNPHRNWRVTAGFLFRHFAFSRPEWEFHDVDQVKADITEAFATNYTSYYDDFGEEYELAKKSCDDQLSWELYILAGAKSWIANTLAEIPEGAILTGCKIGEINQDLEFDLSSEVLPVLNEKFDEKPQYITLFLRKRVEFQDPRYQLETSVYPPDLKASNTKVFLDEQMVADELRLVSEQITAFTTEPGYHYYTVKYVINLQSFTNLGIKPKVHVKIGPASH